MYHLQTLAKPGNLWFISMVILNNALRVLFNNAYILFQQNVLPCKSFTTPFARYKQMNTAQSTSPNLKYTLEHALHYNSTIGSSLVLLEVDEDEYYTKTFALPIWMERLSLSQQQNHCTRSPCGKVF